MPSSRSRTSINAPRLESEARMMSARGMFPKAGVPCLPHTADIARIGRKQDGLRHFVVLGLRKQVHRDPVGIGGAVADHQDFRGAGDHVDADHAEYAALGGGHVGVAGADDLVHRRNTLRSIGERADRLRAADAEHPVHSRQRGSGKYHFVNVAIGRWRHHDELAHARPPWRGSHSSAPRTDRPPCRPARRGRPDRAASPAGRARVPSASVYSTIAHCFS